MSWSQRTIARILLLVASMLADSDDLRRELKHLSNHLSVGDRSGRVDGDG